MTTYFRPKRVTELIQQSQKASNDVGSQPNNKNVLNNNQSHTNSQSIVALNRINSGFITNNHRNQLNHQHHLNTVATLNKTWGGDPSFQSIVKRRIIDDGKFITQSIGCQIVLSRLRVIASTQSYSTWPWNNQCNYGTFKQCCLNDEGTRLQGRNIFVRNYMVSLPGLTFNAI